MLVEAQSRRCVCAPEAAKAASANLRKALGSAHKRASRWRSRPYHATEPQLFVVELVQPLVDGRVMRLTKIAGDAADLRDVTAGSLQIFEARRLGFDHLFVDLTEKSKVMLMLSPRPVSSGSRECPPVLPAPSPSDWGDPPPPTAATPRHRGFGIVGQIGRTFQADIAVASASCRKPGAAHRRPHEYRRSPDARKLRKRYDRPAPGIASARPIFVALADRLFEDRGFE